MRDGSFSLAFRVAYPQHYLRLSGTASLRHGSRMHIASGWRMRDRTGRPQQRISAHVLADGTSQTQGMNAHKTVPCIRHRPEAATDHTPQALGPGSMS